MNYFILMIVLFIIGYLFIALEHPLKISKTATALLLAALMWAVFATMGPSFSHEVLVQHLGDIAEILFFLVGAMTIVEIIDQHEGFNIVTDKITTKSKRKLLWTISILTFFMSAVFGQFDNSNSLCVLY
jgi:Na+/H+ antiporter NhaD/arsenite permease-like protein